jgi:lysophospholipase L1-like esterase
MLDRNGNARHELFGPDGLQLNAAGYALWADQAAPCLR